MSMRAIKKVNRTCNFFFQNFLSQCAPQAQGCSVIVVNSSLIRDPHPGEDGTRDRTSARKKENRAKGYRISQHHLTEKHLNESASSTKSVLEFKVIIYKAEFFTKPSVMLTPTKCIHLYVYLQILIFSETSYIKLSSIAYFTKFLATNFPYCNQIILDPKVTKQVLSF